MNAAAPYLPTPMRIRHAVRELPGVFNRTVSLRDSWKPDGGK